MLVLVAPSAVQRNQELHVLFSERTKTSSFLGRPKRSKKARDGFTTPGLSVSKYRSRQNASGRFY